ncbi:NDP-hexose 2,3-dehydratase family protein [Streptomyces sp. JV180]|uniref:NDP-hexose 2,3-dehydratase family protein n=1 Tax=Streptomyces sp. JV180 TaxID=858634 RepID=UPI00168B8EF2|nr:NDP-hexose 2,3-dehydratase family protein [Streptomyces sp. JV180]MBD3549540.1 NDP-hexose 2,3-dehydratase family protein [Streptomyces sp. JV180]
MSAAVWADTRVRAGAARGFDAPVVLRPRHDVSVAERLARSAAAPEGAAIATEDVAGWLAERARAHPFEVTRIPFDALEGWGFEEGTGNLVHRSGRFFTVEGLDVSPGGAAPGWQQPVIVQPEVGILGLLCREIDGVAHFLLQAKMEPGNVHLLQLSPTVQATHSNYTRVHRGGRVRYVEYFTDPGRGRVVTDALQSEHGSWFLRKANRNMVVEIHEDVEPHEDFRWLTLGQIHRLLRRDHLVNMDTRTVLSCLPFADPHTGALHRDAEVLSWITGRRAAHRLRSRRMPLAAVAGWHRSADRIEHSGGGHFQVAAVAVRAGNREVGRWSQPLFAPVGTGVTAFVLRRFDGVAHVLVRERPEGGHGTALEFGPTVQCTPRAHRPPPAFLDLVLGAAPERIRYDTEHSEEGGRFLAARTRCLIVEATGEEAPARPPAGFRWVTPGQLTTLVQHGHCLNVQARTLLACLNSLEEESS